MYQRGDIVVNVLNGHAGRVIERWGPSNNPFYRDYYIQYRDGEWIARERHLRKPLLGENTLFLLTQDS